MVQIFIGALRWRGISALCQAPLKDLQAFRYSMIGSFFNQTLPSSIGGDAVRFWLVNRTSAGWQGATCPILTARAIGSIALALIIVTSLPWQLWYDREQPWPSRPGLRQLCKAIGAA